MSITGKEQTAAPAAPNGAQGTDQIRGRFLLAPSAGGGAMLYWATGLCEHCLNHGCGIQREPLDLTPGGAMKTYFKLRGWQKDGVPHD